MIQISRHCADFITDRKRFSSMTDGDRDDIGHKGGRLRSSGIHGLVTSGELCFHSREIEFLRKIGLLGLTNAGGPAQTAQIPYHQPDVNDQTNAMAQQINDALQRLLPLANE